MPIYPPILREQHVVQVARHRQYLPAQQLGELGRFSSAEASATCWRKLGRELRFFPAVDKLRNRSCAMAHRDRALGEIPRFIDARTAACFGSIRLACRESKTSLALGRPREKVAEPFVDQLAKRTPARPWSQGMSVGPAVARGPLGRHISCSADRV